MMKRSLTTLALVAATVPAVSGVPVAADSGLAIRSVTVRPPDPVVGPSGSVKLVIDVVARGAEKVSVVLEPRGPEPSASPEPAPSPAVPAAPVPAVSGPAATVPAFLPIVPAAAPAAAEAEPEWEIWRFLPRKPLTRRYPSGPWTVTATARSADGDEVTATTTFSLRRATEIEGVKVVRDGDDVRITGTLLRVDPLGRVDYRPYGRQRVVFCFRPAGSSEWQAMGEATTRKDGWFSARLRDAGDGEWRAEYPGNADHAPQASPWKRPKLRRT